jgi:competence ComEA-like helix-hairpin-helix protein
VTAAEEGLAAADTPLSPKYFDPNTVEFHDLVRLGFSRGEALGIVKYRARGKVFEIPEDFAACYQVSEEMYRRLQPYIRIGEKFRVKPFEKREPQSEPRSESKGEPQAEIAAQKLVDLNRADSATLVTVSGIGALTAGRIVAYRERLGGFVHVGQLAEIRGMTEQNFERIVPQIFVDTLAVRKISINFAPAKSLAAHPYFQGEVVRKLLKQRQLKGGWKGPEQLKEDHIFKPDELKKLLPYLIFNEKQTEN